MTSMPFWNFAPRTTVLGKDANIYAESRRGGHPRSSALPNSCDDMMYGPEATLVGADAGKPPAFHPARLTFAETIEAACPNFRVE